MATDTIVSLIQPLNNNPADDFDVGTETAGTVVVDSSVTGSIELVGDRDTFAVDLVAGQTYQFDLEGSPTNEGTLTDALLVFLAPDGTKVFQNNNGGTGKNARLTFRADQSGTHFLTADGLGDSIGTYRLSVADITVTDDFDVGTKTSGSVQVDGSVNGSIESNGDRDSFAVDLVAGQTYQFDLQGVGSGNGTLTDALLILLDSDGRKLTQNNNGGVGRDSRLTFTATESGTHYLTADGLRDSTGSYNLSVRDISVRDDFEVGIGTSGTVVVDGNITGTIEEAGDRDSFAVELEQGRTYQFDLEGSPTEAGTLRDALLFLQDQNGNRLQQNNNGGTGRNSRLTFTATSSGAHYLTADGLGAETGTYRLSVTDITVEDDFEVGTSTAGSVAVDGAVSGNIETVGDRDSFGVALEAGRTYQFDLEGSPTSAGTLDDAFLILQGGTGERLAQNNNGGVGGNSRLVFTATSTATHFLTADGLGQNVGTYRLSVSDITVEDDFAAGIDTAGSVVIGESTAGSIERIGDRDSFSVELVAGQTISCQKMSTSHCGGEGQTGIVTSPSIVVLRNTIPFRVQ